MQRIRAWMVAPLHWPAAAAMVAFCATFLPSAAFTINHFNHDGSGIDAWQLATLVWRNTLSLNNPRVLVDPPTSYFASHLSPIFLVPALVSHVLPIGIVTWIAMFTGIVHASVASALCSVLVRDFGMRSRASGALAAILSLGFGLGGMAMAALQLPHFEYLIVGFGIAFLAALARGDRAMAWLWLVLAMSVREDAGFHLFGVLLVAQLIHRRRDAWVFLVVLFAASLVAFALKGLAGDSHTNVQALYIGSPPFAHVTYELLMRRFSVLWLYRAYVWQPLIVIAAYALWTRDLLPFAGVAAAVPWTMLHLTATHEGAGTLDLYYPFPFLLAIAWIAIAPAWRGRPAVAGRARARNVGWLAAVIIAGLFGSHGRFVCYPCAMNLSLLDPPAIDAQVEAFAVRLAESTDQLGTLRVDYSVMGLAPRAWRHANWLAADQARGNDTVIWFDPGQQDSLAWATWLTSQLRNHYRVLGSHIMLASNRRLDQLPSLAPALVPTNVVWERMQPTAIAERVPGGIRARRNAPAGVIADGPHRWWRYGLYFAHGVALPRGQYAVRFTFSLADIGDRDRPLLRLEAGFTWGPTVAAADILPGNLPPSAGEGMPASFILRFEVDPANEGRYLELRALHVGNAEVTLRNIELAQVN